MINAIINGLFSLLTTLVSVIIGPIGTLLVTLLGTEIIDNYFIPINNLLNYLKQFVPLAISYLGLGTEIVSLLVSLITANIMIPLGVHGVKLAIRLWHYLVP